MISWIYLFLFFILQRALLTKGERQLVTTDLNNGVKLLRHAIC